MHIPIGLSLISQSYTEHLRLHRVRGGLGFGDTRNGPGVAAYGQCVGYISHHMFVVDADFSSCIEYLLFQIFRLLSLFLIFYLY